MSGKPITVYINTESGYESLSYIEGPVKILGNPNGDQAICPIIKASYNKHDNHEIVKALIEMGANVNASTSLGTTALTEAAFGHKRKILEFLLDHEADVHRTNKYGYTALHLAALSLERERGTSKYENDLLVVRALLQKNSNVNARTNIGNTPLMEAMKGFHLDIVKELLMAGADVCAKNMYGQTCLHLLFKVTGKTDIMIELIKAGASLQVKCEYGNTPYHTLLGTRQINKKLLGIIKPVISTGLLVGGEKKENYYVPCGKNKSAQEINKFVDECYAEVQELRNIQLYKKFTLCEFALQGGGKSKPIADSVYEVMMKNSFKIYDDYIVSHFERKYLYLKVIEKGIYATNDLYDVLLNEDVVYNICKFLPKTAILSFLRAFNSCLPCCRTTKE